MGSRLSGLKPDIDPTALAKLSSKDEIVAALEASFAFDHKAIGTITNANAFESVGNRAPSGATIPSTLCTQAAYIAVHACDEYGQMVEYLRMNGSYLPQAANNFTILKVHLPTTGALQFPLQSPANGISQAV
ncbi:MAG TPA: hypothetical protein VGG81_07930 [Edaphobacter sp.]